jgi:hypothetical protein
MEECFWVDECRGGCLSCEGRVLFSGVRVPFLASESGSLHNYTNHS